MRASGVTSTRKTSVTDIVTSADHAAEALVTERLAAARPGDGVLGEEGAHGVGTTGRRWVIDPVDGTFNFASGLPGWTSAVGLVAGEEMLLGAIYHAGSDTVWVGGPGVRSTRNGIPLPDLPDRELAATSLATYLHPTRFSVPELVEPFGALVRSSATLRMFGCGSLELVRVAEGALGLYAHHSAPPWDWLPGAAIVRGAGGHTDLVTHRGYTWHLAGSRRAAADARAALTGA